MKNIAILPVLIIIFSLAFLSCPIDTDDDPYVKKVAAVKEELTLPAETDNDLYLPTALNGVAISWASSDEKVISNTGIVKQQLYDTQSKLTATLSLGSAADTKEFVVTVRASAVFEIEDKDIVELAFYQMVWGGVLPNWIGMHYSDENVIFYITVDNGSLEAYSSLPNEFGTKNVRVYAGEHIYWNNLYRDADGKLNDADKASIEIVLKLDDCILGYAVIETFKQKGAIYNANLLKSILFPKINETYQNISEEYVKNAIAETKGENKSDAEKVAVAKKDLYFRIDDRSFSSGSYRYIFPLSWNGVAINWVSSNEAVISSTGLVTQQLCDTEVKLTASLKLGSVSDTKEFTVTIPAISTE